MTEETDVSETAEQIAKRLHDERCVPDCCRPPTGSWLAFGRQVADRKLSYKRAAELIGPAPKATDVSKPMTAKVTEAELADQCQHVCLKPDGHESRHFYGYRMGPWSQAELVAEVRRLRDERAAMLDVIEAAQEYLDSPRRSPNGLGLGRAKMRVRLARVRDLPGDGR